MGDLERVIYDADGTGVIADNDQAAKEAAGRGEGEGILVMGSDGTNVFPLLTDASGQLIIAAVINASDIQIGAVEIKDSDGDDRITVDAANTARTTATFVIPVQIVDATGKISPAGEAVGNAPFAKLTDGVETAAINTDNELTVSLETAQAAEDAAAPTDTVQVGGKYEASPTEMDDGDIGPIAISPFKRVKGAAHDDSQGVDLSQDVSAVTGVPNQPGAWTQLTAPGDTAPINVQDYREVTIAVTLALVDTTAVVSVDGSVDGTSFGVVSLKSTAVAGAAYANNVVTLTVNGTYLITVDTSKLKQIRFSFDSETGDVNCTLTATPMAGN